jgi:hypothetical protein
MVGHQAVPSQGRLMLFDALPQQAQIYFPVRVAVQDKPPRISTLCYVMRNSGSNHPRESCHALSLPDDTLPPNGKYGDVIPIYSSRDQVSSNP